MKLKHTYVNSRLDVVVKTCCAFSKNDQEEVQRPEQKFQGKLIMQTRVWLT